MANTIQSLPLDQMNPFQQTLNSLEGAIQSYGNLKTLVKDLNIITYQQKMNAGLRQSIIQGAGASPTLVVTPGSLDLTNMLAFTNCAGRVAMSFDFNLLDKGNDVKDIFEVTWQLVKAVNGYGDNLGLDFIYMMQWQVGAIGQASDTGLFETATEGWSSFQSLIVSYSISKEDLNINKK